MHVLPRYPALLGHPEESDEANNSQCATMIAAAAEAVEDEEGHIVDLWQVGEEATKDKEYLLLNECVSNDSWVKHKVMELFALRPCFRMWRHLSCHGDLGRYTRDKRHF